MYNKESMLEAVKRKRFLLKHEGSPQEEASESPHEEDQELAPEGASSKESMAGESNEDENTTDMGKEGFDKISHKSPENSKPMFQNPKKDTHDPVDLNKDKNMAGPDAENTQHDDMGVDVHEPVRMQSSKMAKHNAVKAEGMKKSSVSNVKEHMGLPNVVPSHGEDNPDASPDEEVNDKPRLSGLKGARAKLDGFLSKMKK